jgi:hypothetical protein
MVDHNAVSPHHSRMKPLSEQEENRWWHVGVPLVTALITWMPYWLRNLIVGQTPWFRIPFVGDATFDTAAYLQPVGHAALGIPEAALIGPFAIVIHLLAKLLPWMSVAELWLITRWISAFTAIWVGAWAAEQWTGLGRRASRLVSLTLWIALALVLGMKPGVFSWFLPLGLIGFACVPLVSERLRKNNVISAIIWSLLIAIATSVYAWYQLFVMPWLAVVWFRWFISKSVRVSTIWFAIAAVAGSIIATLAGIWIATTSQGQIILQLYERLSFSPTHMIFISGSVLMTALWIPLFIPIMRRIESTTRDARLADLAMSAWITLLFVFFHSPFTGHYIQNDHFRSPAVIAAWLSLALVWHLSRRPHAISREPSTGEQALVLIPFFVSLGFVIKIIAAPYAWNGDQINIVQLTHWFALFLASWIVYRWINGSPAMKSKTIAWTLALSSLFIGANAWAAALTHEFSGMMRVGRLLPALRWIEQYVPAEASICADHGGDGYSLDDQISAITGRVVHFAHTTLYHKELDNGFLDRMKTVAGFFDVKTAGAQELGYWQLQATLNQFIVCDQFPLQTKLLKTLGLSQPQIDLLISCPRERIASWWAPIQQAIDHPMHDEVAFKKICPYVVIPSRSQALWDLPAGYEEHPITSDVSVWSLQGR